MSEHVALREYIERVLIEREKALQLGAQVMEQRLHALNQFREEYTKREATFLRLDVYVAAHEQMMLRVERVEGLQSRMIGIGIGMMAASGLIGGVIGHLLK